MATGDPTGADLCVGTTPGDTLPNWGAGYEEREISFGAGAALTSGVKYAIVVRALDAAGSRNDSDAIVAVKWNAGTYANGSWYRSTDSGANWTEDADDDAWFKTKAGAAEKDTYEPTGSLGYEPAFKAWWIAQTFIASSSYTITSVILKMERFQFDTTGTVTVSIKATDDGLPGKPTNPSPTDAVSSITLDETPLSWDASDPAADTYEIYFREQGNSWSLVGVAQAGVAWTIDFGTLAYGTTYEWRVDATNTEGTTTGDTWSFDTISFKRVRISYRLISSGNGNGPYDSTPGTQGTDWEWTGENNMISVKRLVAAARNKIWYENI